MNIKISSRKLDNSLSGEKSNHLSRKLDNSRQFDNNLSWKGISTIENDDNYAWMIEIQLTARLCCGFLEVNGIPANLKRWPNVSFTGHHPSPPPPRIYQAK